MANPFLTSMPRDIETALLLENAHVLDIGNAVAFTDGDRTFVNTDDNLFNILPAYTHNMLKWLLWHEKMHIELRHHNRFFKYLSELDSTDCMDEFHVTKNEVNIIMDILVHDSMSKMFPELVETAINNLAQMRNRNSLKYTFKTFTLEEMLDEYKAHKKPEDDDKGKSEDTAKDKDSKKDDKTDASEKPKKGKIDSPYKKDKEEEKEEPKDGIKTDSPKTHKESGRTDLGEDDKAPEDGEPEIDETATEPEPEHDKTDWSKLDDIDEKEFIDKYEGDRYIDEINRLKRKKLKRARLTETLNGLVTSTRKRTYTMPSTTYCGGGIILKGSTPGRAKLYLCFDASGSMGHEMETFKEIISKSIPQAMDTPTEWFSGYGETIKENPDGRNSDYYKGKFSDFMPVHANCGYGDDGDRTIELCWKAEQAGYSPIGITDGGGTISWSRKMIKELKRTILVGQNKNWLEAIQSINPNIQILDI